MFVDISLYLLIPKTRKCRTLKDKKCVFFRICFIFNNIRPERSPFEKTKAAMKRIAYLMCLLLVSSSIILYSCTKDNDNTDETDITPTPDLDPSIDFIGNIDFVSVDTEMGVNSEFNVGIVATNSGSGKNLVSFVVVKTFGGIPDTVVDYSFSAPEFSWESAFNANAITGMEEWVFTITDENGKTASLSFAITTVDLSPTIGFIQNAGFVSGNAEMNVDSAFNVGIIANSSGSEKNLVSFVVVRTFMNNPDTVVDNVLSSPDYSWESAFNANDLTGEEEWSFHITDEDGESAYLSFIVTTTAVGGEISTYLYVNLGSYNEPIYGAFFGTTTGLVYSSLEAMQNQELIDFAFYFGATNKATLGAPSNSNVKAVFDLEGTWTWFNETLFQEAPVTASEFDAIGSSYSFPAFTGGEDDINHLECDDVVFFKTVNEKLGFVKVNSINNKGDIINIDVKVMK